MVRSPEGRVKPSMISIFEKQLNRVKHAIGLVFFALAFYLYLWMAMFIACELSR